MRLFKWFKENFDPTQEHLPKYVGITMLTWLLGIYVQQKLGLFEIVEVQQFGYGFLVVLLVETLVMLYFLVNRKRWMEFLVAINGIFWVISSILNYIFDGFSMAALTLLICGLFQASLLRGRQYLEKI